VARYDTYGSGYSDRLPGMPPTDPHAYGTAQGSAGAGADGAEQIQNMAANLAAQSDTRPLIVPVQDTLAAGVVVDVHPTDTEVGGQTGLYQGSEGQPIMGGVANSHFGDSGAGEGHANHFRHPNADSDRPAGHA
jgi:hypothetical protein